MPQSPATGEPSPPTGQFQFNSRRFRLKDGCRPRYDCDDAECRLHCDCDDVECRPHCDCDDESAVDCPSPLALVGPLSTPKPNWGLPLVEPTPQAHRPRKRRSRQERNAFGHPLWAGRPLALSATRMLSTVCPHSEGRTLALAPCERLGDPAREVRHGRKAEIQTKTLPVQAFARFGGNTNLPLNAHRPSFAPPWHRPARAP